MDNEKEQKGRSAKHQSEAPLSLVCQAQRQIASIAPNIDAQEVGCRPHFLSLTIDEDAAVNLRNHNKNQSLEYIFVTETPGRISYDNESIGKMNQKFTE